MQTELQLKVLADALEMFIERRKGTDYPQNEVAVAMTLYRNTCTKLFKARKG
jgi:hypothetical protein